MMKEAKLESAEHGLVPRGDGWFIVNARSAQWRRHETFGEWCPFEGDPRFSELGINLHVLHPGKPACLYHEEGAQEDFLVLSGECLVVIEGQERRLGAWDFVHCPPRTEHVFVGAGTGPCLVLMVGVRKPDEGLRYPVSPVAARHGASVEVETPDPREAYARFGTSAPCPPGWRPPI